MSTGHRYWVVNASQISSTFGAICCITVSIPVSHAPQWFMLPAPSSNSGGQSIPKATRRIAWSTSTGADSSNGFEKSM